MQEKLKFFTFFRFGEKEDEITRLKIEKGLFQETIQNLRINNGENFNHISNEQADLNAKINQLNQEQENLLTLLADMDAKLHKYRKIAKKFGQEVSEDEADDREDDQVEETKTLNQTEIISPDQQPIIHDTLLLNAVQPVNSNLIESTPIQSENLYQKFDNLTIQNPVTISYAVENISTLDHTNYQYPETAHNFEHTLHANIDSYIQNQPELNFNSQIASHEVFNSTTTTTATTDNHAQIYPKNNIYQIIESNMYSNSNSDNSSPNSDNQYYHNHRGSSSEASSNFQNSPNTNNSEDAINSIQLQMPPKPEIVQTVSNHQLNDFNNSNAQHQFNFLQYFNNPQQTELFQNQFVQNNQQQFQAQQPPQQQYISATAPYQQQHQDQNQLQNYFK
jgi:hypothetical protein